MVTGDSPAPFLSLGLLQGSVKNSTRTLASSRCLLVPTSLPRRTLCLGSVQGWLSPAVPWPRRQLQASPVLFQLAPEMSPVYPSLAQRVGDICAGTAGDKDKQQRGVPAAPGCSPTLHLAQPSLTFARNTKKESFSTASTCLHHLAPPSHACSQTWSFKGGSQVMCQKETKLSSRSN